MSACPKCGKAYSPGRTSCAACAPADGEGKLNPQDARVVGNIDRKVAQTGFTRSPWWEIVTWSFWGGVAGFVVGIGVGLRMFGFSVSFVPSTFSPTLETEVIFAALVGLFLGVIVGGSIACFLKPIFAALFWDVRAFERKYGDEPAVPRSPSGENDPARRRGEIP
jgi:hypothetical protein